jgi:hypothetical protein
VAKHRRPGVAQIGAGLPVRVPLASPPPATANRDDPPPVAPIRLALLANRRAMGPGSEWSGFDRDVSLPG